LEHRVSQPYPPPSYPAPAPAQDVAPPPYSPAGQPSPQQPSKVRKLARFALPVVGALVAAGGWLGLGGGAPEVGDCIQTQGESDYDVVDCAGGDAQYKVVGVEAEKYSREEFDTNDTLCARFTTTEVVLWAGGTGSDGAVLCAEPV
jgi:hypothetical protein